MCVWPRYVVVQPVDLKPRRIKWGGVVKLRGGWMFVFVLLRMAPVTSEFSGDSDLCVNGVSGACLARS